MGRSLKLSNSLVLYWEDGRLVCEDYLTRVRAEIAPEVVPVLDRINRNGRLQKNSIAPGVLASLDKLRFIGKRLSEKHQKLGTWKWGTAAKHFYFATKDAHKPSSADERRLYAKRLQKDPMPDIYKTYKRSKRISLTAPTQLSEGTRLMLGIKDTRNFNGKPITLSNLSETLLATCGKRSVVDAGLMGKLLVKGYYSAGNRHPLEVYPVIFRVEGLRPGVYHYDVKNHSLELLKPGKFEKTMREIACRQDWIQGCAAAFLITAVFERTDWKYRNDFGLRSVFGDFGHLSQSIYLAATSLGLGACTTYSVCHAPAEKLLGIDGVSESFLSLVFVGCPAMRKRSTAKAIEPAA